MAGQLMRRAICNLFLIPLIFASGCAVTVLTYESGIDFKGEAVTKSPYGDFATLDQSAGLKLRANCARVEERAGMLFPVFPAPPVIPVGEDEPQSLSEQDLYIIISADDWQEYNPGEFEITIDLEGVEYIASLSGSASPDATVKFGSYYFATQLKCGQIKSSTLQISYRDTIKRTYEMQFKEGYRLRAGYLGA
jgi:hypothetical protein